MALIFCPDCGIEVSEQAKICNKCGFPIESIEPNNLNKLKDLKTLFDDNLLTKEEYIALQKEVLLAKKVITNNNSNKANASVKKPIAKEEKSSSSQFILYAIVAVCMLSYQFYFKGKIFDKKNKSTEIESSYNSSSTSNNSGSSSYNSGSSSYNSKTCSWCGKSFSGSHYTHLGKLAPCQSSNASNSIGKYCSMECCSDARKSSCPSCYERESKSSDGRVYDNNACSLCKGTGIEKNRSSFSNEYGRVCPMCDGKGRRGY